MRSVLLAVAFIVLTVAPARADPELTTRELRSIIDERDRQYGQRFDAQEKAVAAALAAAKEAVVKAEGASEKRFDSVNEFRATLKDQQVTLMPRAEADVRFRALEEKMAGLVARQIQEQGRSEGSSWLWGILIAVGTAVGAVVSFGMMIFRQRPAPRR